MDYTPFTFVIVKEIGLQYPQSVGTPLGCIRRSWSPLGQRHGERIQLISGSISPVDGHSHTLPGWQQQPLYQILMFTHITSTICVQLCMCPTTHKYTLTCYILFHILLLHFGQTSQMLVKSCGHFFLSLLMSQARFS